MNFGNCYCKVPLLPFKPFDHTAPDLFSSYGYVQLIDIPTRLTGSTTSLRDTVHVTTQKLVVEHGTLPQIADHEGTVLSLDIERSKKSNSNKIIYDYASADVEGLNNYNKVLTFKLQFIPYLWTSKPKS